MEIQIKDKSIKVTNPDAVESILKPILAAECEIDRDKEHFWVIGINNANKIKYLELVGLGTLNATLVAPREIFRFAIMKAVSAVILCHNHPSGQTRPSEEDLRITKQISEAGKIIGINVLDHVIIGEDPRTSFQEVGLI